MVNRTQYKQAKKLYLDLFPEERDNFEDNLDWNSRFECYRNRTCNTSHESLDCR